MVTGRRWIRSYAFPDWGLPGHSPALDFHAAPAGGIEQGGDLAQLTVWTAIFAKGPFIGGAAARRAFNGPRSHTRLPTRATASTTGQSGDNPKPPKTGRRNLRQWCMEPPALTGQCKRPVKIALEGSETVARHFAPHLN